jgi:PAS domain-containing protein
VFGLAVADPSTVIAATVSATVVAVLSWIVQRRTGKQAVDAVAQHAGAGQINGWLHQLLRSMPYPAWVKVVDRSPHGAVTFRMQFVNDAYEEWFGVKWEDYKNKTDYDIWPKAVADEYYKNDAHTLANKNHVRIVEKVPIPLSGDIGSHKGDRLEFEKVYIEKNGIEAIMGFVREPMCPQEDKN